MCVDMMLFCYRKESPGCECAPQRHSPFPCSSHSCREAHEVFHLNRQILYYLFITGRYATKKKHMPKTLACSHRTPSASPPKLQQLGGCLDFGLFVLVHVSVHPHSGQVWHTQRNKLIEMGEKTIIGGPAVDGTKTYIIDES